MKIFFCAHDVVEFDGENYYSNPISYMSNRYSNSEDTLICYAPIIEISNSKSQKIVNDNIRFINAPKIDSPTQILKIRNHFKNLKIILQQCDFAVIHIHVSIINYLCVLASKKVQIPYMTVVVGCAWDALWNHSLKGKLMAPVCFILEKVCQRSSNYSIYVTKDFLQKRYPSKGAWIACSNVELNFKKPPIKREKKSETDTIHLATVAAVDVKYKGQQYVLKALGKMRDSNRKFIYHLVGAGDSSYLQKLARQLNISDIVVFHGPMKHDDISTFLDNIDIYIQPSKQEGLPRSVIEAMSRGCLCMGSNIAGIPELITSRFLFRPGNYQDITKILKTIDSETIYKEGLKNIEKAKSYSKGNLDTKRNAFINEFKKSLP